ncbi:hypothetical protein [Neptunomonas sp.]|uniref:hypothetical protein n=1 Tax=Neptunomonas sp. TaxID=1971898 RepID=UPI0025D9A9F5|nr:hypothetical protein [Neptunomonas sp.]
MNNIIKIIGNTKIEHTIDNSISISDRRGVLGTVYAIFLILFITIALFLFGFYLSESLQVWDFMSISVMLSSLFFIGFIPFICLNVGTEIEEKTYYVGQKTLFGKVYSKPKLGRVIGISISKTHLKDHREYAILAVCENGNIPIASEEDFDKAEKIKELLDSCIETVSLNDFVEEQAKKETLIIKWAPKILYAISMLGVISYFYHSYKN